MKTILFAVSIFLLLTPEARCEVEHTSGRPNILFMMSDDHCAQAISAYGSRLAEVCPTPNIDRIAKEGMRFDNCFVTNSICTPSRSAIFTGKYAHKNGVYKFTALNQSQPTLPKMMQRAGYLTGMIGKYHLHSNPVGFDLWSILPGQGEYYDPDFIEMGDHRSSGWVRDGKPTNYSGHCTDVIASKAIDTLRRLRDSDKPFLLFCHFKAPHDTWDYAKRYENFLDDVEVPEPTNLFDDYQGRSDMLRKQLQYIGSEWGNHTNFKEETAHLKGDARKSKQYQLYLKKYLRCVKGVDDNVGRILDYLDESGLGQNTIVVYTADQGFFLGEHGLYDKRIMYEEALRMPLLVRWPNRVQAGSVSDAMVLNVDFAATLLEIAGAEPHSDMQGRSFLPLLNGDWPEDWRKSMYYRYYRSHFETEAHYGVRTLTHKLIHFHDIDQWEMYDLRNDPTEMHNLADDPEHRGTFDQLKKELFRLQTELEDDTDNKGEQPDIGELESPPLTVNDKLLNIGRGDLSILLRFRSTAGGTLFARRTANSEKICMTIESDRIDVRSPVGNESIKGKYVDNRWHTLALVYHDDLLKAYVDGQLALEQSAPDGVDIARSLFRCGAGFDAEDLPLQGELDQVQFYDRPLNERAIRGFAEKREPTEPLTWKWVK